MLANQLDELSRNLLEAFKAGSPDAWTADDTFSEVFKLCSVVEMPESFAQILVSLSNLARSDERSFRSCLDVLLDHLALGAEIGRRFSALHDADKLTGRCVDKFVKGLSPDQRRLVCRWLDWVLNEMDDARYHSAEDTGRVLAIRAWILNGSFLRR